MKKLFLNSKIVEYINVLNNTFGEEQNLKLPAKVAFIIEYNTSMLYSKYEFIEKARVNIGKKYGVLSEDKSRYILPKEKIELAEMELEQLMGIEQTVELIPLPLKELDKCDLTLGQIKAILFMIEQEEE